MGENCSTKYHADGKHGSRQQWPNCQLSNIAEQYVKIYCVASGKEGREQAAYGGDGRLQHVALAAAAPLTLLATYLIVAPLRGASGRKATGMAESIVASDCSCCRKDLLCKYRKENNRRRCVMRVKQNMASRKVAGIKRRNQQSVTHTTHTHARTHLTPYPPSRTRDVARCARA